MKTTLKQLSLITVSFLLGTVIPSQAAVVVVSGTGNQPVIDFLNANFNNITEIRSGDFANFSAQATTDALLGADLVIIGRTITSSAYQNVAAGYNTLTIPVVSLTSYASRQDGNRLGWHASGATANQLTAGDETTVTAAGSSLFGTGAGVANFFENNGGGDFNGLGGAGDYGGAQILSTIGTDVQAAYWETGSAPGNPTAATVATFAGPRLLFNLDNDPVTTGVGSEFVTLTPAGNSALVNSLVSLGLVVPEPSTGLLGLAGLALLALRRRK